MKIIILLLLSAACTFAQQVYKIPFNSRSNSIELAVLNKSLQQQEDITVYAENAPVWIHFDNERQELKFINNDEEASVEFKFDISKDAPINKDAILRFNIQNKSGDTWKKEITISIAPPDKYELFQNYPNPFNPVTTISWQLPVTSHIELKVFDILGEEITTLVNETKEPGYYTKEWNASQFSTGVYIYTLKTKAEGKENLQRKKMLLIK